MSYELWEEEERKRREQAAARREQQITNSMAARGWGLLIGWSLKAVGIVMLFGVPIWMLGKWLGTLGGG
jgi:hypothetical protein